MSAMVIGASNNVMLIERPNIGVAVINKRPDLSQLRDSAFLSDVTLEIAGMKRYPVHKNILAVSSEYFKTLFSGRFRQSTMIKLDDVKPSTLDLYLDMIYGKEIVIHDWQEIMKLLQFAKFTQTNIPQQDDIIKNIVVSSKDFVPYIQALGDYYENEIPLDIIKSLKLDIADYELVKINFGELGEEFIRALIETRRYENDKYIIAQKAVNEGMTTNLYGLVRMERLDPRMITVESVPYLQRIDKNLLSSSTDLYNEAPVLLVNKYRGIEKASDGIKYSIFITMTKDNRYVILVIPVKFNDKEKYVVISSDKTEQDINEILTATFIKVKEFRTNSSLNRIIGIVDIPGAIGPFLIEKYELF